MPCWIAMQKEITTFGDKFRVPRSTGIIRKLPGPICHNQHTLPPLSKSRSWQQMARAFAYSRVNQSAKPTKIAIKVKTWTRDVVLSCSLAGKAAPIPVTRRGCDVTDPSSPPPEKQLKGHLMTGLPPQGPFVHLPLCIFVSGDSSGQVGYGGKEWELFAFYDF